MFWGLLVLLHVSLVHSFLFLSRILSYGHITFCFSIYKLEHIWIVSSFELFQVTLLWIFKYKSLHRCVFLTHQGVKFLDHLITFFSSYNFLRNQKTSFSKLAVTFCILTSSVKRFSVSLHPYEYLRTVSHFFLSIIMVMWRYHTMVWAVNSIMNNSLEVLFTTYLSFVYLIRWSVCSDIFVHFFIRLWSNGDGWVVEFIIHSGQKSFIRNMLCKYSAFLWTFCFLNHVFWRARYIHFYTLFYLFFSFIAFKCRSVMHCKLVCVCVCVCVCVV